MLIGPSLSPSSSPLRPCACWSVIRFFRAVEYFNEFLKAFSIKDDVEKYLSLFKSFWLAVWMACDHVQWLQKAGYLKLTDLKKFDEYHSKGWFFGLVAGFIIAAYKLRQAIDENRVARAQLNASLNDPAKLIVANKALKDGDAKKNKQIMAMVKNGVDMVRHTAHRKRRGRTRLVRVRRAHRCVCSVAPRCVGDPRHSPQLAAPVRRHCRPGRNHHFRHRNL